jgi:ribosomal protein S18 acetylase RimI-like enzyme
MEPDAVHRCGICGDAVTPASARLVLSCDGHLPAERWNTAFKIRPAVEEDADVLRRLVLAFWGHEDLRAFGRTYDHPSLDSLVADVGGGVAGFVSAALEGGEPVGTIVALGVPPLYQGLGVGGALLGAAVQRLTAQGADRIRLATTNDNLPALALYQRHGFVVDEVRPGEVAAFLEEKLGAVPAGFAGIPVRDEIRLVYSG